ncbi:MAG TPA: hypothetical protein H9887_03030 [Candidatus Dorea intestinavium]|nr:hypothetical protein [Candidatus Dorea intestinavium]
MKGRAKEMKNLLILRDKIKDIYAKESNIIDKVITFILAFATFMFITKNIGFTKMLSSPLISFGLAIICAFIPRAIILPFASILILMNMYSLPLPAFAVTTMILLIMYIFYFRYSPKHVLVIILTPLAFALKIPYLIPIAFGLVATPVAAIPVSFGIVIYYVILIAKKMGVSTGESKAGMLAELTSYTKQIFQNPEMIVYIIGFAICLILVYTIRRLAINYAWRVAIVSGTIINILIMVVGEIAFKLSISFVALFIGSIIAAAICLVLEFFLFNVDYMRRENLEFEDDNYVYYVKAIPKVAITATKKTVKKINEDSETEILDAKAIREKNEQNDSNNELDDKTRVLTESETVSDEEKINQMLFTKSLEQELELKKK